MRGGRPFKRSPRTACVFTCGAAVSTTFCRPISARNANTAKSVPKLTCVLQVCFKFRLAETFQSRVYVTLYDDPKLCQPLIRSRWLLLVLFGWVIFLAVQSNASFRSANGSHFSPTLSPHSNWFAVESSEAKCTDLTSEILQRLF